MSENNSPSKSYVSTKLTRGMSDEDTKKFEGAYIRSKRVLRRIHEHVEREAERGLQNIDNPQAFSATSGEWANYVAWNAGYRFAMRSVQELTRT
jgi:hypothetical protein